ncbi:DUF1828 domain-containing protein [Chimaeribacter arupi]|uniref:DUF1828 domain-containing protein n=1 Tax=Chimaeribacter arupi TaxID=2060066 RepID=UPI002711DCC0|nr:DUF1828 domain-containing protein [Chimaeribacter arupi]WKZ93108.1 DUF1828 domain-containing protein [Chimaeribacter arupi]
MMCSTVISRLGFECHPLGNQLLRIISPFTYCDDGEHVGAFVQEVNGRYRISDRCDALMNIEARGISLTKKRMEDLRQVLAHEGVELNERGEMVHWAESEERVGQAASTIIRSGIVASALSLDWYSPLPADKFESHVINFLTTTLDKRLFTLQQEICGLSGHTITVPVTIQTPLPKYIFTVSVKEGGNWNGAYSLLGKLIDLRQASPALNNRYVIVDSESIGAQMQQLCLLFNESSQILPFTAREHWISRLVA